MQIVESGPPRRKDEKSNQDMQSQDEEGEEEMEQQFVEDDDSQENEDEDGTHNDQQPKRVRELLATIRVPYKGPDESIIFSYHYKYEKYLRDNNLIDPEKAKQLQERLRRKQQLRNDKTKEQAKQAKEQAKQAQGPATAEGPAAPVIAPPTIPDGEDLSGMDEDGSYPGGSLNGKYRFDQLIKTMIARIEFNNTLAPVQEYGRHQTRALKKKKGKGKGAVEEKEEEGPKGKNKKDFDDRFYDLDDNFIDDGDMEDGYGAGLEGMGGGGFDQYMNEDFYNDRDDEGDLTNNAQSSINVEYDPLADARKETEHEEKRYQQIVKRFRVIRPEEVEKMLSERPKPVGLQDGAQNQTPTKRALFNQKLGVINGQTLPSMNTGSLGDNTGSKKRTRDEMMTGQAAGSGQGGMNMSFGITGGGNEGPTIENLIQNLKTRVLNGETLNNFKKEIADISKLIEKCENQQMFEKSVYWLAQILQKPEKEISLMLKRNCLQDKKKKKKSDIDRKRQTVTQLIERELKEHNSRLLQEGIRDRAQVPNALVMVTLQQLEPGQFVFAPSEDLVNMFMDLKKQLEEFKTINNEYIQIKLQEEKVKNKKQKGTTNDKDEPETNQAGLAVVNSGGQKLEEITLEGEVDKTMKLLVDNIPEKIRQEVHDRLVVAFGIKQLKDFPYLQKRFVQTLKNGQRKGSRWNKITSWYTQFTPNQGSALQESGKKQATQRE